MLKLKSFAAVAALSIIGVAASSPTFAKFDFLSPKKDNIQTLPNFADLVEELSPSVVNISTTSKVSGTPIDDFFAGQVPPQFNDLFKNFFGQAFPQGRGGQAAPSREVKSLGSGFVIDETGYVVTNRHVIDKADKIEVNFPDGSSYAAKVIGEDAKTDLALIKIESDKKFPALKWGDSDEKRVGEWVLAIGNPYGLSGTVTKGIISALNRDIDAGPYDNFIQTDAAINRGNSGGPLFDLEGNVIGVNTAIISPSGGSVGVGFAIPSSLSKNVIEQLRTKGKVERGWIGVNIQPVTQDIADSLGLKEAAGAMIGGVTPDSPAEKAGLLPGDVIISVEGKKIEKMRDLPRMIAERSIGASTKIGVIRQGKVKSFNLKVAKFQEEVVAKAKTTPSGAVIVEDLGISLRNIDPVTQKNYSLPETVRGVLIDNIQGFSNVGWRRGDVIAEIQKQPIQNVNDFVQKFSRLRKKGQNPVLFKINRQGNHFYLAVRF